jgi:serine/threonine protein kinase
MEKTALMMLNNKHVLKGLLMCESKRECFMITEYCNGGTLKALIRESAGLGEARTLDIVRGILTGYGCLLEHGVVHRDLKPANIMLHENQPKIIDFGYC